MAITHTPGPWRQGKSSDSVVCDAPVSGIAGADSVEYYGGHLIAESIAIRNRPIIAAAPELLDALVYLRDCIESGREPGMSVVNAAIAKATKAQS